MRRFGFAFASMGFGLAAVGLVACSGDDTDSPLPDAGADATVIADGGAHDGASPSDAAVDVQADGDVDGATCIPFDAAGYTDAEVQAGLTIVLARKCEGCHGEQLQGNQNGLPSTNADGGMAYPPDLTPDPVNGLGCWTNDEIERAFLHGIDKEGEPLCNPMPQFGEEGSSGIDDAGAGAVVAYLRSIPIVVNPHVPKTPACYPTPDAGEDAGHDAGEDAGMDAGHDAGEDAGIDAGTDAGSDATADAGTVDATIADGAADGSADAAEDAGSEDAASDDGG